MRHFIFLLIAISVLAGLWLSLKPQARPLTEAEPVALQTSPKPATTGPALFVLEINKAVVSGPAVFKVQQDDAVDIRITSDKADEAHLHGYDLHAELQAGIPAHLRFSAEKSGRFELELHGSHQTIGVLEVYPRP